MRNCAGALSDLVEVGVLGPFGAGPGKVNVGVGDEGELGRSPLKEPEESKKEEEKADKEETNPDKKPKGNPENRRTKKRDKRNKKKSPSKSTIKRSTLIK